FPTFFLVFRRPPTSPLFPYTSLFRSCNTVRESVSLSRIQTSVAKEDAHVSRTLQQVLQEREALAAPELIDDLGDGKLECHACGQDRKSTRLNSSHVASSYAVFCLKKK